MQRPTANWLNKIPFARLLVCLIAGILLQWQLQLKLPSLFVGLVVLILIVAVYSILPVAVKFRMSYLGGTSISLAVMFMGAILTWLNDIRHNTTWIGHQDNEGGYALATIEEPLVEKANSFKALATVHFIVKEKELKKVKGKLILYFKKDSSLAKLQYGSQIVFNRALQTIRNNGNPGGFDYQQYCLFQGITHQVYLTEKDFELLPAERKSWFRAFILACSDWTITTLQKFIPGKKEQGLAEALLIGYKDDLDKSLVQAYSNTGVVHVIAISGLHLGLIYTLLLLLTNPLKRKKTAWLRLIIILAALWLFSILAGAQPSVLRSAVMFSFIALGEVLDRRASVFNTLALSAFVLLCYNPYWLWDVGFQLSYAAVLSILIFFRPVYNWFYFENKMLDFIWKINAVTMAAQLLTLPVSIYHFHQLPTLFLFTNVVAVPLSSIILLAEILLCVLFFIEPVGEFLGSMIHWMIWCMNSYIERWDKVSFSVWSGLSVSILQTIFLTGFIIALCCWLMEMKKRLLQLVLICLFCFITFRSISFIEAGQQKKLIVYNVPKYQAIDLVDGRTCGFIGDTVLVNNELKNFHLQPSRITNRIKNLRPVTLKNFSFYNSHVLIIDSTTGFRQSPGQINIDLLILSGNPRFYLSKFLKNFLVRQIVIDGSVPAWKSGLWKKDCDSLQIPCHDVSEEGAFVMNL